MKEELDLYTCPRTGATTKYFRIATDRGIPWEEATRLLEEQRDSVEPGFYRATYQAAANKEIYVLALRKASLAAAPAASSSFFHLVRPNTGFAPVETHRFGASGGVLVAQNMGRVVQAPVTVTH